MSPPRLPPYRVFALDANGHKRPLEAHGVVIEIRPGVEVEVDFAPHPNFAGQLVLFTPAIARMERLQRNGVLDDFVVVFGGSNVLHVAVERRVREGEVVQRPSAPKSPKKSAP